MIAIDCNPRVLAVPGSFSIQALPPSVYLHLEGDIQAFACTCCENVQSPGALELH